MPAGMDPLLEPPATYEPTDSGGVFAYGTHAVVVAVDSAIADVRAGLAGSVPAALRDGHYPGAAKLGHAQRYVYPHDLPEGVAAQQYSPDELVGKSYYQPSQRGTEKAIGERLAKLRSMIRGEKG